MRHCDFCKTESACLAISPRITTKHDGHCRRQKQPKTMRKTTALILSSKGYIGESGMKVIMTITEMFCAFT